MKYAICAIYDTCSKDVAGGAMIFPHDAVAVRTFGDVIKQEKSFVAAHLQDMEMHRYGWLDTETNTITPDFAVLITGHQWASAQPRENG